MDNYCDSSAARGVINRQGVGKIKHLEVKHMWVQEKELKKDFTMHRVPRAENVADVLTHKVSRKEFDLALSRMGAEFRPGAPVHA